MVLAPSIRVKIRSPSTGAIRRLAAGFFSGSAKTPGSYDYHSFRLFGLVAMTDSEGPDFIGTSGRKKTQVVVGAG